MNSRQVIGVALVLVVVLALLAGLAQAQEPSGIPLSAGFTYQGRLEISGSAYSGVCDFQFSLWDNLTEGTQYGTTQTLPSVALEDGVFTVLLDYGPEAFLGEHRWLEIHARCPAGSGAYTTLAPRQQLTPSPYALYAMRAPWLGLSGVPAGFADDIDNDTTFGAGAGLTLSGTTFAVDPSMVQRRVNGECGMGSAIRVVAPNGDVICQDTTQAITASVALLAMQAPWAGLVGTPPGLADGIDNDTTYAAGTGLTMTGTTFEVSPSIVQLRVAGVCEDGFAVREVLQDGGVVCAPVGGGGGGDAWLLTGNVSTTPGVNYVGTSDNQALVFKVYGQRALRLEPTAGGPSVGPNVIAGYVGNWAYAGVYGAAIAGGGSLTDVNTVTDLFGTVGGGANNHAGDAAGITDDAAYATVAGGLTNSAGAEFATVGGGTGNGAGAWVATIAGGSGNKANGDFSSVGAGYHNTAAGCMDTVAGGEKNTATSGNPSCTPFMGLGATVGGGYSNTASSALATIGGGSSNTASGSYSTIGGGYSNLASSTDATVGGGDRNTASGSLSTVSGGDVNTASGTDATVGGGYGNVASGSHSTIGGGNANTAGGIASIVPGGVLNVAQGAYSFAAGRGAKAYSGGCFVWGDSTDAHITCDEPDRWVARASGGVYFYTNAGVTTGMYLPAGGTSWNAISDRATKENFSPVDGQALLAKVAAMPVQEYNLKSQDDSIRHIGPVAQDFAAFGYGESDTAIDMEDADGVALAAIQALKAENDAQQAQIGALQAENDALGARLAALEAASGRTGHAGLPPDLGLLPLALVAAGGGAWAAGRRRTGGQP